MQDETQKNHPASLSADLQAVSGAQACPTCGLMLEAAVAVCPQDGTKLEGPLALDQTLKAKYEILATVGSGGMGVVYKARQILLNKTVAIKMMHAHLVSREAIKRFQIEGQATCLLSHPGIISVHDLGITEDGQPYMVMDFVEGKTLSEILAKEGALPLERFRQIFLQTCDALAHAHEHRVLHRDIKPSNIMVALAGHNRESVRIMDFGIAKLMDDTNFVSQQLTRAGESIGSPLYMSPEQSSAAKVDERSDLYSLGCVIFEALTGAPPFRGKTALATLMMHSNNKAPYLVEASLGRKFDPQMESIVGRLLAKDPDDRYQSMRALEKDLLQLPDGNAGRQKGSSACGQQAIEEAKHKSHSRAWSIVAAAAVVLVLVVAVYAISLTATMPSTTTAGTQSPPARRIDQLVPPFPQESDKVVGQSGLPDNTNFQKGLKLRQQGRYGEAKKYFEAALAQLDRQAKPNYPEIITVRRSIADCMLNLQQFPALGPWAEGTLELAEKFSANDLDKAAIEEVAARALELNTFAGRDKGPYWLQAIQHREHCKRIYDRSLLPSFESVGNLRLLANDLKMTGNPDRGIELDLKAISDFSKLSWSNSPDATSCMSELADLYLQASKPTSAIEWYLKASNLCSKQLQQTANLEKRKVMEATQEAMSWPLASCYIKVNQPVKAEETLRNALKQPFINEGARKMQYFVLSDALQKQYKVEEAKKFKTLYDDLEKKQLLQ